MSQSHYFQVKGMTCAGCETTIQSVVGDLSEVEICGASHRWGLLEVQLKPGTKGTKNIIKEVADVGFDIQSIQSIDHIFNGSIENTPKTKHYLVNGLINVSVGAAWYAFMPVLLGLSLPAGIGVNLIVLGMMLATGNEFYSDAWAKLKAKRSSMNSLIALSTLTAWTVSLLGLLSPSLFAGSAFAFMPIFMILGITNLGRSLRAYQETKAFKLMQSFDSLFEKNQPKEAKKLLKTSSTRFRKVPFSLLHPDDKVLVGKGEQLPVDGLLVSNKTLVNQKVLTGESLLTQKEKGDKVFAGTINMGEPIVVKATCKGPDNTILELLQTVRKAQLTEHANSRMDKLIQYFVPGVIAFAGMTSAGWWLATGSAFIALNTLTSVLLCACPCALGLAAPLSQAFAIYKLLHHGVLIKDADKLQSLSQVDTLVFDKTGTLTEPKVSQLATEHASKSEVLQIIASLENSFKDKHPIASALVKANKAKDLLDCQEAQLHASGQGVQGKVDGNDTLIGSLGLIESTKAKISPKLSRQLKAYQSKRLSPICVVQNNQVMAVVGMEHILKPDVASTLKSLSKNFELMLLTGDSEHATRSLTKGLPLSKVWTDKSADQKQAILKKLKAKGKKVAYVGDGFNDLKAALSSMVSIAVLPWTQLAAVADISLKSKISDLPKVIKTAKVLNNNVNQNLLFNLGYNSISLATAAGILAPWIGVAVNPLIFSTMMAFSSICVVLNASRMPGLIDAKMDAKQSDSKEKVVPPTASPRRRSPVMNHDLESSIHELAATDNLRKGSRKCCL